MSSDVVALIPVYRGQAGLDATLASLACASGNFDVIVVDDGSPQPIQAPSSLRGGISISLLRLERNRGIAGALNQGLALALDRGYEYIARLDAADTVAPERFERQAQFLRDHPACAVVSSSVEFVDATQNRLFVFRAPRTPQAVARRLHIDNCVMHPASMIRVSALREVGVYREDFLGAEDYELFLRMSRRFQLAAIPEVLTRLQYDPGGLSVAGRRQQRRSRLKLQLTYFDPICLQSFFGVARSLLALAIPASTVYRLKRVFIQ